MNSLILLVEDDEDSRDFLSRLLKRQGYEVLIAVNGQEAISMAIEHKPDLVLMDLGLPVLNGLQATRILKSSMETINIPVIALTAHSLSSDRANAKAVGCDDYDTKPIDFDRLLVKIMWLIKTAQAGIGKTEK